MDCHPCGAGVSETQIQEAHQDLEPRTCLLLVAALWHQSNAAWNVMQSIFVICQGISVGVCCSFISRFPCSQGSVEIRVFESLYKQDSGTRGTRVQQSQNPGSRAWGRSRGSFLAVSAARQLTVVFSSDF